MAGSTVCEKYYLDGIGYVERVYDRDIVRNVGSIIDSRDKIGSRVMRVKIVMATQEQDPIEQKRLLDIFEKAETTNSSVHWTPSDYKFYDDDGVKELEDNGILYCTISARIYILEAISILNKSIIDNKERLAKFIFGDMFDPAPDKNELYTTYDAKIARSC